MAKRGKKYTEALKHCLLYTSIGGLVRISLNVSVTFPKISDTRTSASTLFFCALRTASSTARGLTSTTVSYTHLVRNDIDIRQGYGHARNRGIFKAEVLDVIHDIGSAFRSVPVEHFSDDVRQILLFEFRIQRHGSDRFLDVCA